MCDAIHLQASYLLQRRKYTFATSPESFAPELGRHSEIPPSMVLPNLLLAVALVIVATAAALPTDATTEDEKRGPSAFFNVFRFVSIVALVGLSAIFSGLTLGLLSLDKLGLEVTIGAGERDGASDEERANAAAAARILPVRANGNELLSTLVLGNTSVNSLLSILLADLTSGLVGFLVSTAVIVTFGEIIPQALCSRHALAIGSRLAPLIKVLLVVFYPAAKPVSIALNYTLGADSGQSSSRSSSSRSSWSSTSSKRRSTQTKDTSCAVRWATSTSS